MRKITFMSVFICSLSLTLLCLNFQAEEKEWISAENGEINEIQQYALNESPVVWMKTYGGRRTDQCWALDTTADGGFILVGDTASFGLGGSDFWLVKVDTNGQEEWNKTYGGSHTDYAVDGHQTSDHGFILVGGTT